MICPKCNKEIKDGSRFCEFCGAAIEGNAENGQQAAAAYQPAGAQQAFNQAQPQAGQAVQPKRAPMDPKKRKLIGIISAAAVLVLVVAVVLIKTHKTKIDLQDYAKVAFSGYDGYGTALLDFDSEKFMEDFAEAVGIKGDLDAYESLGDLDGDKLKNFTDIMEVYDDVTAGCQLDKSSGLKNGDAVTLSFKFDNDKAKELGVKFVGDDLEVKASGLEEVTEIDVFENVKVEFSGTSPFADIIVENQSQEEGVSGLDFTVEPEGDLKIGDTVTLTVDYDPESLLQEYGYSLKETQKEYTVENVDAYVTASKDMDDAIIKQMKTQTENIIKAYFAGEKEELKQSGLKYEGYYFLSNNNPDTWSAFNQVYIVYSATVKSKSKSFKTKKVYFPVKYTNVIKYADGTLYVDTNTDTIEGRSGLNYGWWGEVKGYTDKSNMKAELVTSQKANYTDEAADGLE